MEVVSQAAQGVSTLLLVNVNDEIVLDNTLFCNKVVFWL